jgi:hypothetical protein
MIFMSQSGITAPQRQVEWDQWYVAHLQLMLTVNGITSAQRFRLLQGDNAPSLALYTVAAPEVFDDPYYLCIRGMGTWLPLVDRRHYRRNLFAGLDAAPEVPATDVLLVADRDHPGAAPAGLDWTWLQAVALDGVPAYRGIAVVPNPAALGTLATNIASYRPITVQYRS